MVYEMTQTFCQEKYIKVAVRRHQSVFCFTSLPVIPRLNFIPFFNQGKFSKDPSVFVTAEHHRAGLKRDAVSIWLEDIGQSSVKICLRELQNYAGSHEDIYVVSI